MSGSSTRRLAAGLTAAAAAGGAAWLVTRARHARGTPIGEGLGMPPSRPLTVRSADGTEIHTEEFGDPDAPPIVLVHAWMCSLELWHRQIEALSGEARLIALDLRGHGRSGLAPSDDYSIEAFARDLDAVLDARLGAGERAVIAGHSMGAMTVAAWAHEHPAAVERRCSAVAMFGTGLGDLVTEALVVRGPAELSSVREWLERTLMCTEVPFDGAPEAAILAGARYLAFGPDARAEDVALVARMVRACDRRVRGRSGGTLSTMDVYDGLAHLDVPASVVAGASDRMTPPVHSHKLAGLLPRAPQVIEAPGCGHMVPLEAHETVTAELRRLLAESRNSAPKQRADVAA